MIKSDDDAPLLGWCNAVAPVSIVDLIEIRQLLDRAITFLDQTTGSNCDMQ